LATVIIVFDGCIFGDILIAQRSAAQRLAGNGFEAALIKARHWALDAAPFRRGFEARKSQPPERSANRFGPG